MSYFSEDSKRLIVTDVRVQSRDQLLEQTRHFGQVCVLRLPADAKGEYGCGLQVIVRLVAEVAGSLGPQAILIVLGEPVDLVHVHAALSSFIRYQLWIAIKRDQPRFSKDCSSLPQQHFGALIHTQYKAALRHVKTRIRYTYCPVCNKTTKDYGGKKHTYHEFGTLMSDVWRDISADLEGDLTQVINRFADLFGVAPYKELRIFNCQELGLRRSPIESVGLQASKLQNGKLSEKFTGRLLTGDCLKELKKIPDNSVDFAFADPPYNLRKKYSGYGDDLQIAEYFKWCDEWIAELLRVLRCGRTCAILNIPLWAMRHFLYLEKVLKFQNWIVWDALSFPVRFIMPSHYAILCFSKGEPRALPGLESKTNETSFSGSSGAFKALEPLAEGYCLRANCVATRKAARLNDRGPLTDLWWDIHRLKHNSRRVDHPCQLPPQLMYRLISLFTKPGEVVLDPFNGVGTTTLTAHQLGRKYIGVEISEQYRSLAQTRHEEVLMGFDPFRKVDRILTAKNSPVPRMLKQKYVVPKKTLQLEVKRVAGLLGHLPTREEVKKHGGYPIEYFDKYFVSWGEVCAAARTTGMSEDRTPAPSKSSDRQFELFVMESKARYGGEIRKKKTNITSLSRSNPLTAAYFERMAGIVGRGGKATKGLLKERAKDRGREDQIKRLRSRT